MTPAELLSAPLGILIARPWLALVPAALFAALYRASSRRVTGGAAALWALYAVYEYGMHRRWLCGGECNIRIDLLLLYPLLFLISVVAGIAGVLAIRRRHQEPR